MIKIDIEPIVVDPSSETVIDTEIKFNEAGDYHLPSITDTFIETGMNERRLNVGALQDAFMKT